MGIVVSDKKTLKIAFLKLIFDPLTYISSYATNWNHLNKLSRGPPKNQSFMSGFGGKDVEVKMLTDHR